MHPRLENDESRYPEQPDGLLSLDPQLDLLLLDDRNLGRLARGICSEKRARNSVSEDIHR